MVSRNHSASIQINSHMSSPISPTKLPKRKGHEQSKAAHLQPSPKARDEDRGLFVVANLGRPEPTRKSFKRRAGGRVRSRTRRLKRLVE